jgi:hypothetical protein
LFEYFQHYLSCAFFVALGWDLGMFARNGHSDYGESPDNPALPDDSNALNTCDLAVL